MNWQLAKVRLAGIGPPDARFDPLDLEFLEPGGARPLDTILWLVNGGGKTVLLRLLFTVLRPDQATQVGVEDQQAAQRRHRMNHIGAFLIGSEPGHVILEWALTDGGRVSEPTRLVTGLVAAVQPGRSASELSNVRRVWYTIRSDDGATGAGDIRILTDGRRVSFPDFCEALDRLGRGEQPRHGPRPAVRPYRVQEDWVGHLNALGIDAEVVRYQLRMNRGESSANNFLAFATDRDFVRFLLDAVLDADSFAGLDASLAGVAAKIARAPDVDRELAFATAILGRLGPLAEAVHQKEAAAEQERAAELAARRLRDALASTEHAAREAAAAAARRRDQAQTQADELDRTIRGLDAEIREYRLAAAELHCDDLVTALARATETRGGLSRDVKAWSVAERLVRQRELTAELAELKSMLDATIEREMPLRERRNDAALALRVRLAAEIVLQRAAMAAEIALAKEQDTHADDLDKQVTEAAEQAVAAKINRENDEREMTAATTRRDSAVRAGIVRPGESAKQALKRTHDDLATGAARNAAIIERQDVIIAEVERRAVREENLTAIIASGENELTNVRTRRDAGEAERARLSDHAAIRGLAGDEPVDLELVGSALVSRLAERATAAARRRIDLAVRGADDRRALDALETSGLLPPSLDAEETATILGSAGIPAKPGWRYLTDAVDPERHDAVIAARPELAAGVIVLQDQDLERARAVVATAGMDPSSVLVIGRAADLVSAESGADALSIGERIVLPPPRAMHDTRASEAEVDRRRLRVEGWDSDERKEADAASVNSQLADQLGGHLALWPAGALAATNERIIEIEGRLATTRAEKASSQEARAALRDEDRRLKNEAQGLAQALRDLDRRVSQLEALADDEENTAARAKRIEELRSEENAWREIEESRRYEAKAARGTSAAARDRASEARNTIQRLAGAAGRVSVGEPIQEPDEATARKRVVAGESLDELQSRFDILDAELTQKTTGSPIAVRLAERERELASVAGEVVDADVEIRQRAEALLGSEHGVDAERRRRAREATERDLLTAVEAATAAKGNLDVAERDALAAQQAIDQARRPRPSVTRPPDRLAAERLAAERSEQRDRLSADLVAAGEDLRQADSDVRETDLTIQVLFGQREVLEGRLGERAGELDSTAVTFSGDRAAVAAAVLSMGRALDDARKARTNADTAWQGAATTLRDVLAEERYANLAASPLGRRVGALAAGPAAVESIAAEVRLRTDRLRSEVEELRQHRELLVSEIAEATDRALRELGQAERRSRLPDVLHSWSGEPFLKIRFERPVSPEDVRARLAAFIVDVVSRPAERRPSGAALLLEACEAAIIGDFAVQLLKPNDAYALRYVPIRETAIMSNGQRATAAMCLMMIISALRAKNRTKGVPGLGVLFLDNPFGNASAGYLVGVQRRVAAALGIQPVYTTGLRDYDAIAPFRNIVALSNDQARGRMLRYVRAHSELLSALAPRDGQLGHLSASQVLAVPPNES